MGKTSAAATATLLLKLCTSSYGQELPSAARKMDNQRRSLRSGMAADNFLKEGESQSEQLHTKISATAKKAAPQQNSFYDLDAFTAKEKDEMIDMIYSLRDSQDSIDWDAHRDNYEQAVKQSMSRSQQSSDEHAQPLATNRALQGGGDDFDGDVFDQYEYSKGNCPNSGSLGVPCAPDNLPFLCNKYNRDEGSFRECLSVCKPGFCCIHNAPPDLNWMAPNCNTDENCAQYNWCYIAWWKLQDTIGPALFLRIEQNADEWFDIDNEEVASDVTGDPFFQPFLLHFFGDIDEVIVDGTVEVVSEDGTVTSEFNADRIFLDEDYWDYKPEY
ncbi:hypothetical protein QTG54_003290 [Skeletonema marinoi]|uniref:Uncharacterized protein n=1 Tax=Skeletonema marinoi TaxID=267567 RepID=A0AAD8YHQ0_9STRA|nr:hypothetical protein QTG54_003290 [Skeletonema marinoi]